MEIGTVFALSNPVMNTRPLNITVVVVALVFVQGCASKSRMEQAEEKNQALQREIATLKEDFHGASAKLDSLDRQLVDTRRLLVAAETNSAELQAVKLRLEDENLQLKERLTRLALSKPGGAVSRQDLEAVIVGKSKDQVRNILGSPTSSYGTASSFWKYGGICFDPSTRRIDDTIQLDFAGDILRTIRY